jgi:hypothetical protein
MASDSGANGIIKIKPKTLEKYSVFVKKIAIFHIFGENSKKSVHNVCPWNKKRLLGSEYLNVG